MNEKLIETVKKNVNLLHYVSEEILNDKEFALKIVEMNGFSLFYFKNFHDDFDVCLTAIKTSGCVLRYVSDRLKDNEELAYEAVSKRSFGLMYVSDRLKDNHRIVKTSIENNGRTLFYASLRLRDNLEIIKLAMENDIYSFSCISDNVKNDRSKIFSIGINNLKFEDIEYYKISKCKLIDYRFTDDSLSKFIKILYYL